MKIWDIESDGLLPGQTDPENVITRLHCINGIDTDTEVEFRFSDHEFYQDLDGNPTKVLCPRDGDIADALDWLDGDVGGHNIIGYDIPAVELLYPDWTAPTGRRFDSSIVGKCIYPNLEDKDWNNKRKGKLPQDFYAGGNSLKQWAQRAGGVQKTDFNPKDYGHTWKTMPFTQEMDEYCMSDVRSNVDVIKMQMGANSFVPAACDLELAVAEIIKWQERVGIKFDEKAGEEFTKELYIKLNKLEVIARDAFAPFWLKNGKEKSVVKPHRRFKLDDRGTVTRKVKGEVQRGWWCETVADHQPVKLVEFNPGSRAHIANRMKWKYKWEPVDFTPTGLPEINEEILGALPFEETKTITKYMTVQKRLSQLAEGKQAWLKVVKNDGRIYGRVDQLGCGTARMSHFGPNLAQVPKSGSPYGTQCRALFVADTDRVIVGCDADALELRILAHFLARFDGGAYVATVLDGNKADGTDMHTRNRIAIGLEKRDTAKTWFYAFIYGSGDFNLGTIVLSEWGAERLSKFYGAFAGQTRRSKITAIGRKSRAKLLSSLPAFAKLVDTVQYAARRGYIRGLDKRQIPVRSKHSVLNFLCQGAGALVMKKALVLMFAEFKRLKMDVLPLLNIHDEVQLSTLPEESHDAGKIAARSIKEAGEFYELRCPLAGDYDIGKNWAETH